MVSKRLGVVLGGGGARGVAHVGVLRALTDVDLNPDVVVGVSMGAVVGATYAAREDWWEALRQFDRSPLPGHENLVDLDGFDLVRAVVRSAIRLAPKAISFTNAGYEEFGQDVMRQLLADAVSFDDLRVPFAAVATDVARGRRAVLDSGDVADAVIASAALPILTRPIASGDSRFLDGGFADPAPVDVARTMGADVVVMVHVGTPPSPPTEPDGPVMGMLRGLEVGLQRFVDTRLQAADVLVMPSFDDGLSWMSFDRAEEAAEIGHAAMRAHLPELLEALER